MTIAPRVATMSVRCAAPPETVYDLLADLGSHLDWAGAMQSSSYRLLTLDAPAGAAHVGSIFMSTGSIPMSNRRWEDRSTVTAAYRPARFEFLTEGTVVAGRTMRSRWLNSYAIKPDGSGSVIEYRLELLEVVNPFLRLRGPMGWVAFKFMIPMLSGRAVRNLAASAADLAAPGREKAGLAHHASET